MSFFGKIGTFFKDLFEDKTAWEKTAAVALGIVKVGAGTIATLALGPAAAAKVNGVITQVQNDLAGAETILASDSGGTAQQQLLALAKGVQTNFATLLTDADVKNDANAAKITEEVNLAISALDTIIDALPA
jgi:hypothetical protein